MQFSFSQRSERALTGVHPDLVRVARLALAKTPIDFIVTEGVRTKAKQEKLVASGASRTMNSRHLTGHAIDIAPLVGKQVRWDWPLFHTVSLAFKDAAQQLGIPIVWGGDWRTFKDGPHFELDRRKYP